MALSVAFYIYWQKDDLVENKIGEEIKALHLPVDSFRVEYKQANLILYNVDMFDDFYHGTQSEFYKANGLSLLADSIVINGIDWWKLYNDSLLVANSIQIFNLNANLSIHLLDSMSFASKYDFKNFKIGQIKLNANPSKIYDFRNGKFYQFCTIQSSEGTLDSFKMKGNELSYQDLKFYSTGIQSVKLDRTYTLKLDSINYKKNAFDFKNIQLIPLFSKANFATNTQKYNNLFSFSLPHFSLLDSQLLAIHRDNRIVLDELTIRNLKGSVYTNLKIERKTSERLLVSEFIKSIDFPFKISTLKLKNASIDFELVTQKSDVPWKANFTAINGTFSNVTNMSTVLKNNDKLDMKVDMKIQGKTNFNLSARLNLLDDHGSYSYTGQMDAIDFMYLNPVLEDLEAIRFKSIDVQSLGFQMQANKYTTKGTVDFLYKDLNIKRVKEKSTGLNDPFRWFVYTVLSRENNVAERHPKKGKVDIKRISTKSVFYNMWDAMLEGMSDIILP